MAKILVSTKLTQGQRQSDFSFVPEGEIVTFGFECDNSENEHPDAGCGCQRSLVGLECMKGTTTFIVRELEDVNRGVLAALIFSHQKTAGWASLLGLKKTWAYSVTDAKRLMDAAARFPEGAIIEKRNGTFQQRETR